MKKLACLFTGLLAAVTVASYAPPACAEQYDAFGSLNAPIDGGAYMIPFGEQAVVVDGSTELSQVRIFNGQPGQVVVAVEFKHEIFMPNGRSETSESLGPFNATLNPNGEWQHVTTLATPSDPLGVGGYRARARDRIWQNTVLKADAQDEHLFSVLPPPP